MAKKTPMFVGTLSHFYIRDQKMALPDKYCGGGPRARRAVLPCDEPPSFIGTAQPLGHPVGAPRAGLGCPMGVPWGSLGCPMGVPGVPRGGPWGAPRGSRGSPMGLLQGAPHLGRPMETPLGAPCRNIKYTNQPFFFSHWCVQKM